MFFRPCVFRPMFRVAVIRNPAGQNLLIVLHFFVHIGRRHFRFFYALICLHPLPENDLIPCVKCFSGLRQAAQIAVFFNILNRRTAALQTGNPLHPVNGFLVKNAAVAFISLAGQKIDVGIIADCMFCRMEHFGKLFQCISHGSS